MEQKYIVALELSGTQVKGAAATVPVGAFAAPYPTVECIAYADKVNCVHYGRVQNLIDAANHANFVVQKIANDPKLEGATITGAYVGISGSSLGSIQREGTTTLSSEMEITDEILKYVITDALKTVPGDRKVLEVIPRRYIVDNQVVPNPVGVIGTRIKGEYTIVICKEANQRNLEKLFNERVNLDVHKYVVTPLAVGNLVLGEEEKKLGCVLVDFGAQTTTISIYKNGTLQYLATLPLGGANITHDIALGLNTTDERAEAMKLNQGNATPDLKAANTDSTRINCYVQARAGEIIANLMAQIGYADYKPSDLPGGIIITGRAAKLRNFDKCLEAQSKMKVRRASLPAMMNVPTGDPTDFTSLVAIVSDAAKLPNVKACIEFAKDEEQDEQYAPSEREYEDSSFPLDENEDDEYWGIDDDEAERLKAKKAKKAAEAQAKAEKDRQRAAEKAKRDRQRREEQRDVTDDLDETTDTVKKKKGFFGGVADRLVKLLSYEEETDDTDLDSK